MRRLVRLCWRMENSMKQYDQAIESATQALALNDKLTRAYAIRGMSQSAKGDTAAAYSDLSMAVTVNPNDPDAQFAFAQVYEKQGNFGMAATAYRLSPDGRDISSRAR